MKKYSEDTVYFISYARLPAEIAAAKMHHVVGVGLIINRKTGLIEDSSCTLITAEAKEFLKQILVGHNLHEEGIEALNEKIKKRFHGLAQKSLCVAVKASCNRYFEWTEGK
ncbi:MAG: DUF3870 domain-containing protein [Clostridiales bacterium]|nr:DUF3870 domain-containing protein [Clostridiales bacterium]